MLPFPRQSLSGIGVGLPCRSFFSYPEPPIFRRLRSRAEAANNLYETGGILYSAPVSAAKPLPRLLHRSAGCPPSGGAFNRTSPHAQPKSSLMTVHAPKLLTPEEFASLIEIAITSPDTGPASGKADQPWLRCRDRQRPCRHGRRSDPDYRERMN